MASTRDRLIRLALQRTAPSAGNPAYDRAPAGRPPEALMASIVPAKAQADSVLPTGGETHPKVSVKRCNVDGSGEFGAAFWALLPWADAPTAAPPHVSTPAVKAGAILAVTRWQDQWVAVSEYSATGAGLPVGGTQYQVLQRDGAGAAVWDWVKAH